MGVAKNWGRRDRKKNLIEIMAIELPKIGGQREKN